MRKIFGSFTARLTFYILTLTFLIFLCIALVFQSYAKQKEEWQANLYTAALQQNLIQHIDARFGSVESSFEQARARVDDLLAMPDSMKDIARGVLDSDKLLTGVGIAFRPDFYPSKGRLYFEYLYREADGSYTHQYEGAGKGDYTQRKWFRRAMDTGETFWAEPYVDYDNQSDLMTSYVYPCRDRNGEIFAVLLADVLLTDLTEDLDTLRPYKSSYSFILSAKGVYVSSPNKEQIVSTDIFSRAKAENNPALEDLGHKMTNGEQGSVEGTLNGKEVLLSYAPMPRTGWSVCSVNLYDEVMESIGTTSLVFFSILVLGLLVLFVCIQLLVYNMSKPLRELTGVAYEIAHGNFDTPLPNVETKDDVRKLHDAFAHMQQSLTNYIEELKTTTRTKERIESELSIAHNIQMSLIPKTFSPFPDCNQLELYAYLKPAKEVGGDFYDFFIRGDKLFFTIGDVSGKGIPASLVMVITRTLLRIFSADNDSPADIATKLNNAIAENNDANMFVTMYLGTLDLNTGKMVVCNAGHNPPVQISAGGEVRYQDVKQNLPIGVLEGFTYQEEVIACPKGDAILLYTDGLTEAENAQKEQFGEERTLAVSKECPTATPKEIVERIYYRLFNFTGEAEQSDDLTLLCFRLNNPTDK